MTYGAARIVTELAQTHDIFPGTLRSWDRIAAGSFVEWAGLGVLANMLLVGVMANAWTEPFENVVRWLAEAT